MKRKTVTIAGVEYDSHTGLRLDGQMKPTEAQAKRVNAGSTNLHKKAERTKTLKRSHVKAPAKKTAAVKTAPKTTTPRTKPQPAAAVHTRSPMIRKFASHDVMPARKRQTSGVQTPDKQTPKHPSHEAAKSAVAAKRPAHQANATSHKDEKQKEIAKALAASKPAKKAHKTKKSSIFTRHPRLFSIATAGLVVVLLAGYFTYINIPYITTQIAAMQAGVNASYPTYQPSGYSLEGPVTYDSGRVEMKFTSNTSSEEFSITQSSSELDSSSLKQQLDETAEDQDFTTLNEGGLTIYRNNGRASWVNGGVLHDLSGDAPLSDNQIKRIARSM